MTPEQITHLRYHLTQTPIPAADVEALPAAEVERLFTEIIPSELNEHAVEAVDLLTFESMGGEPEAARRLTYLARAIYCVREAQNTPDTAAAIQLMEKSQEYAKPSVEICSYLIGSEARRRRRQGDEYVAPGERAERRRERAERARVQAEEQAERERDRERRRRERQAEREAEREERREERREGREE